MFQVGDLVVCIDDKPKKGPIAPIVPIHTFIKEGRVYRINFVGRSWLGKTLLGLDRVALPHPMKGFAPYRFQKISGADDEFSQSLSQTLADANREMDPA